MSIAIALAQINPTVGDLQGNASLIIDAARSARDEGCGLVVYPELSITGYPPEDLLLRRDFIEASERALDRVVGSVEGVAMILGHPRRERGKLYNAASFARGGAVEAIYYKQHLPNYSVFDEKRYFESGHGACVVDFDGIPLGLTICEDIWEHGPVEQSVDAGARVIININASPFHIEQVDRGKIVTFENSCIQISHES